MGLNRLIIHLSDLHFGKDSRFKDIDIPKFGSRCAKDIQRETGKPDLVIVTGDITQAADKDEFTQAGEFFRNLQKTLKMQRSRFVFLPGNHDLSWKACKDHYRVDPTEANTGFNPTLFKKKFQLFEDFKAGFYGKDAPPQENLERGACLYVYEDLRICIAAFNSSQDETHTYHTGKIDLEQSQSVINALENGIYDNYIRIIALHYPLNADSNKAKEWIDWLKEKYADDDNIEKSLLDRLEHDALNVQGNEEVKRIAQNKHVHLVLHGHQHAYDSLIPFRWAGEIDAYGQICPAGSFGIIPEKLPDEQPNCMRLLQFKSKNNKLEFEGILLEYDPTEYSSEKDLEKGCFRNTNRAAEKASFPLPLSLMVRSGSDSEDEDSNDADEKLLEYVRQEIEFILEESPNLCTSLSHVFKEGNHKTEMAKKLLQEGIGKVWNSLTGNLNRFKKTLDELQKVFFLLALVEIKREHIEELRNQLKSSEETNFFHLHSGVVLMAEFMLKAALESELRIKFNVDDGITPSHMVGGFINQKKEDGLDHEKAQNEVLHGLKARFKIQDTFSEAEVKKQLKSRLKAHFDSKEPFYTVHQYENSFAIPYLVEFLQPDCAKLPNGVYNGVTRIEDSYLDELLNIIYKKIMKLKPQDS